MRIFAWSPDESFDNFSLIDGGVSMTISFLWSMRVVNELSKRMDISSTKPDGNTGILNRQSYVKMKT
mgnify:CR=1 FL=1